MRHKPNISLVSDHLLPHYQTEPAGYRPFLHYGLTDVEPDDRTFGRVTERAMSYLDEVLTGSAPWAACGSRRREVSSRHRADDPGQITSTLKDATCMGFLKARSCQSCLQGLNGCQSSTGILSGSRA